MGVIQFRYWMFFFEKPTFGDGDKLHKCSWCLMFNLAVKLFFGSIIVLNVCFVAQICLSLQQSE